MTETLWEINDKGRAYLEKQMEAYRYKTYVSDTQMRNRLDILHYLNNYGPGTESDFPSGRTVSDILEKWPRRAKILSESIRKTLRWLADRSYIANVGSR